MRAELILLGLLTLGGCAATAPDAVEKGYPAASLFHGALPQCRPNEDIGPCTAAPLSGPNAENAFPDGGFRDAVREKIRQRKRD